MDHGLTSSVLVDKLHPLALIFDFFTNAVHELASFVLNAETLLTLLYEVTFRANVVKTKDILYLLDGCHRCRVVLEERLWS